ncbi:phosphoribosylamine--glycine ligase [Anaerolineales bacterium]
MNQSVLIIGAGGREHALAWKLAQSKHIAQIYVAPGNGGTDWQASPGFASCQSLPIQEMDFDALLDFARSRTIDLTVIGPEAPLAAGIVDLFLKSGLQVFGPSQQAARLESSKAYARDLMRQLNIPSPIYGAFDNADDALAFINEFGQPLVVKADGLAAGKGVLICDTPRQAQAAVSDILLDNIFGPAGDQIVIEERLHGEEFSVLAFCDGHIAIPMRVARDYKRALDGDLGLNTGGMGAFAPAPDVSETEIAFVQQSVLQPIIDTFRQNGTPYIGVLYAGLMRTATGLKVLEFNCRFGDPETQVVLPMLKSDLYEVMLASIEGRLADYPLEWQSGACATVVLASPGYPSTCLKGLPIRIDSSCLQSLPFHAGTSKLNGDLVTSGGRVLALSATAATLNDAFDKIYADIDHHVSFDNMHYRKDIGGAYRV